MDAERLRRRLLGMRAEIDDMLAVLAEPTEPAQPEAVYMSPEQYAERIGVTADTVRRMVREKRIPCGRVGRSIRIPVRDADAAMAKPQDARRSAVIAATKGAA